MNDDDGFIRERSQLDYLTELHDWMRAHGVSQMRVGDIHLVLDELPGAMAMRPQERMDSTALPRSPHDVIRRKAGQEE
jgi:hypothetical protein